MDISSIPISNAVVQKQPDKTKGISESVRVPLMVRKLGNVTNLSIRGKIAEPIFKRGNIHTQKAVDLKRHKLTQVWVAFSRTDAVRRRQQVTNDCKTSRKCIRVL